MATIEGGLGDGLRGNLDGLSFYKMRGIQKTVVRKSSGHTKNRIKNDPNLRLFKKAGQEFAGRALMSKFLMRALTFHKPMADYNIAGPLTALMKPLQVLDPISRLGKRNILLSQHSHYIKGFSLNKFHLFDSVVRFPVTATVDRETLSAKIQFPELMPGINFAPPVDHPYYCLRVSLAVVPDIVYNQNRYTPSHLNYPEVCAQYVDSEWYSLQEGSQALEMEITTDIIPPDNHFTLVLSVGILYGEPMTLDRITQVRHAGSAKILEVG